jgi:hypothetical protein
LVATLDEIGIEAQIAAGEPADVMRRAFIEIARLTCEAKRFAEYLTGGPPLTLAGA